MNTKRRITIGIAIAAISTLGLAACSSGAATTTGGSSSSSQFVKKSPLKFGYDVWDQTDPYWLGYLKGIQYEAKLKGVKIVVADSKDSPSTQVSNGATLISQQISALIVSPVQPNALPTTINAAHAAKIPVIVGDVGTAGKYDTYIVSNNTAGGAQAADWYINKWKNDPGTHKIAIIGLAAGVTVGPQRVNGFINEIKAKSKNIEIVSQLTGQTIASAYTAAQNALSAHPDIDGFYAANSNNAQGAIQALQSAHNTHALVVGFNGDPIEMTLIAKGQEAATVAQDPYTQGRDAVLAALALLNGKTPAFTDASTKTILVPTKVVDSSNLTAYQAALAAEK